MARKWTEQSRTRSGPFVGKLEESTASCLPVAWQEQIFWLLQRIRGLWRLYCAIVFCKCFRDYFRPAVLTRLFDDADYVLIAHPHGTMRVVLYAIDV
jgi:hypothetical protein